MDTLIYSYYFEDVWKYQNINFIVGLTEPLIKLILMFYVSTAIKHNLQIKLQTA